MSVPRDHHQEITHWASTPNGYGGYTFGTLDDTVMGRWEDRIEAFLNLQGEEEISNALVSLDKDVAVNDYLYLGISAVADPTTVDGARRVRRFDKASDLRGLEYNRKAYL